MKEIHADSAWPSCIGANLWPLMKYTVVNITLLPLQHDLLACIFIETAGHPLLAEYAWEII